MSAARRGDERGSADGEARRGEAMSAGRRTARRAEAMFAIIVLTAAAALAISFAVSNGEGAPSSAETAAAVISRDGVIVQTIDLSAKSEPRTFRFVDDRGSNLVEIDSGRIRVADADCPDRICVHTGWIEWQGQIIACVPHGLTIVIEHEGEEVPHGPDAVAS